MAKRKRRTGDEIKRGIIKLLEKQDFSLTTGQVANRISVNWDSANKYLNELKDEGVLFYKKVGRQNQWCIMRYYRHGFP